MEDVLQKAIIEVKIEFLAKTCLTSSTQKSDLKCEYPSRQSAAPDPKWYCGLMPMLKTLQTPNSNGLFITAVVVSDPSMNQEFTILYTFD